jgi:hypothetical protein
MQKNIIYIILSLFLGCSTLPRSQGEDNQVVIFASPEDKLQIQPFMNKVFEKIIRTPQRESEINITWQSPWEIELYKYRPNLIIISLDYPSDSTGDRLLQRFQSMQSQKDNIFIAEDLFAQNQQVVSIHAQDAIHFQQIMNESGQWLKKEINTSIGDNIWQHMVEKGKNEALQDSLLSQFNISAFIQADYQLIAQSQNFLWLGRGYPYRWLTFTSANSSHFLTVADAWKAIEKDLGSTMPQINLLEILRSEESVFIEGSSIRVMHGVYEHIESETGGPFVIYLFDGHVENEVILASGFVNNPGREKEPLLRQLELTIQKIKFN